jgi:glycosyltransferase involved in cell wall biosynthesis
VSKNLNSIHTTRNQKLKEGRSRNRRQTSGEPINDDLKAQNESEILKSQHHSHKKTICYIAGREAEYSRTLIVHKGLEKAGFRVIGIFPPDKHFIHYPHLLWRLALNLHRCDLIVVGFYGQLLLLIVRLFTRKPILYDIYISTFDTLVFDREKAVLGSMKARIYWWADRLTMKWSNCILLETQDHIDDYSKKFNIPREKFEHIFLAVDDSLIYPVPDIEPSVEFLVHFHGEYAPFHGVKIILKAAHILKDEGISFEIIGTGITWKEDRALAEKLQLENVRFIDWVPYSKLTESMCRAHCCLGIFGENPRTMRVLTNKVVEALAAARPLITVKNNPVEELLTDGESVLLVPPADPGALADAIRKLKADPRLAEKIGKNGYRRFRESCTLEVFSNRLKSIIHDMADL